MSNIEVFTRVTAEVFKELYEAFPKPIILQAHDLRSKADISDEDWWEESRGIKGNSAGVAIIWLHDEGFIRYQTGSNDGSKFTGVVLTTKGLTAMNRPIKSLEASPTVGDRLKELSKTTSTEIVVGLVKIALSVFEPKG